MILEGLNVEYAPVVSFIERKFGFMDLDEVEILLLAHEIRLSKFKKSLVSNIVSVNLNHFVPQPMSPKDIKTTNIDSSPA